MSDLPPPVTRNSSKKELWEELEAVRAEVDSQQRALNEAREQGLRGSGELKLLRHQVSVMRAVLTLEVR